MKAVFIGSISTLADTSELQRKAFNHAFAEAGLDWHWSSEDYRARLSSSGGRDRIAAFAKEKGIEVDAEALHARKTEVFLEKLRGGAAVLREQTQGLLEYARQHDLKLAFVSGTARESLEALVDSFGGAAALGFDLVTASGDAAPKPAPDLYLHALDLLDLDAADVLAIEDNRPGVDAAKAAGLTVLAYPNENTAGHDFSDVDGIDRWSDYLPAEKAA
ncbi:HAD family hydrolase [Sulfitobacter aestuariivivens]|uniref:HAD-IA family hydrolase n=1 Tax=Sulfitobacter aestuariivivens TaxID=2766981 RepID=A0A927D421_9RHOB|nr:HAD-IA family hydrolase [Sulfitobacter aestuariivivens]MBD3664594.1 HAD-IA family hydrolase [Sulfitobacter aestuariivivens]